MLMKKISLGLAVIVALIGWQQPTEAQVVPGTGQRIVEVGDDFEDANWSFTLNLPKASTNIDKVDRQPAGFSNNSMWFESGFRGTPDFVKRVETPPGGLPGSTGALAMQTLYSGIPGRLSNTFQQDDLIANVHQKLGYMLPASWTPSYVVRVYIPPFETWEQRSGSSFGFRADCQTMINKPTKTGKFFRTGGTTREMEQYWPGFFIQFNAKNHPQHPGKNTASLLIRSGERGQDIPGPVILNEGWWTLGMTITPDGKVHYYGHEGVANLTAKDHLYSNFPYGYTCLQTSTYFFNVVNQDDGRSWSTRWIVDDPKVYVATGAYVPKQVPQTALLPAQPVSQTKPIPEIPAVQLPLPVAPPSASSGLPALAPTVKPTIPALQATPSSATPLPVPVQAPALQTTPALQGPPVLQPTTPSSPASTAPKSAADSLIPLLDVLPQQPKKPAAASVSSLPPLLKQPSVIVPATAGRIETPAPALLPEPSASAAPAISQPTPAPSTLPVDVPAALPATAPATPPVPATPEG